MRHFSIASASASWANGFASLSLLVVPCIGVVSSALLVRREIGPTDVAALGCVLGAIALVVRRPAASQAAKETQRQTS